jgi:hypothetical protein
VRNFASWSRTDLKRNIAFYHYDLKSWLSAVTGSIKVRMPCALFAGASSLVHEYSAGDDFYQSELKMEAASTGVTLHFPNQSPNAG